MRRHDDGSTLPHNVMLTRRGFVKAGGALVASLGLPAWFAPRLRAAATTTPDPTKLTSWLEIRADGTVIARSGKAEMGTGTTGEFMQVVAEELYVRPETVSVVLGSTDESPDGGMAAGSLWGAHNLRKVAAYT